MEGSAPRWVFSHWELEIPFCATSPTGRRRTMRSRRFSLESRARRCDVIRLNHAGESLFFINTLNMGFAADVATLTNRRLKFMGELGYLVGVLVSLARLRRRPFPLSADAARAINAGCRVRLPLAIVSIPAVK